MRIALLDPPSYSPAYDHHLASALAARGHHVELLTSPFAFGEPPAADSYRRVELFLPLSGRLLRGSPRSRLRFPLKAAEYGPSVVRLLARIRRTRPEISNVQWLPLGRRDLLWARRLPRPRVLTAHNVLPHAGRADADERRALYREFDRIIVHTRNGGEQLARFGVPPENVVRIAHGTFDAPPTRPVEPVRRLAVALGVDDRIDWRLGYLPDAEVEALTAWVAMGAPWPNAGKGGKRAAGKITDEDRRWWAFQPVRPV
ncbi:MAG: glycosyltransferase family 4 protein, partial [Actinomycetota bacterium]|nr:glycosyltransferase family 4 protein [Actinomycetota bacterium]